MNEPKSLPAGRLVVHTDGSCKPNPGPGGWAVVPKIIAEDGTVLRGRPITGSDPYTTNNRMELTAAIEALKAFPGRPIEIVSDSEIVVRGATEWLPGWQAKGWRTAAGKAVANGDLWQNLNALASGRDVVWAWVRGHAGSPENEIADRIAGTAFRVWQVGAKV